MGMVWIAGGLGILIIIMLFDSKIREGLKYVGRAVLGIGAVFLLNMALVSFGISVGINLFTIAVTTFLGIPGIIMLYGLQIFI